MQDEPIFITDGGRGTDGLRRAQFRSVLLEIVSALQNRYAKKDGNPPRP
jgi:hypothetical protein